MAEVEGQLNDTERAILAAAVLQRNPKPEVVLEIGTWFGGGSTLHFLRALEKNGCGHLYGIECNPATYDRMIQNIRQAAPEAAHRFTPLFGFSHQVLPRWIGQQAPGFRIDVAFLDGGNNPQEQMDEFFWIDQCMPVGGHLLAHDANLRKGSYFVPYLSKLDNWESHLYGSSAEGLFSARKIAVQPTPASRKAADAALRRRRNNPVEVVGRLVGSAGREWLSRMLPLPLVKKLTEGRSHS